MNIDKFLEIEKKYNLYYLNIEDINYWEYSRFEIWNYVFCAEKLELHSAHRKRKTVYAFTLIGSMLSSFYQYVKSKKQAVDVCFVSHERRIKEKDFFDCMYTEDIVKRYPNSIVLESPHNYSHLAPVSTQNLYYTDWIVIVGNLYAKMHAMLKTRRYKKVYGLILKELEDAYNEMKEFYQFETILEQVVKINVDKFFMCKIQYKLYENILKKFNPKVIVEVCYYRRQCMLINEIAKKRKIPIIELQHGTMHSEHAAYQYNTDSEIKQLPNEILLFSEYWKDQINFPISSESLVPTGFPYFEKKLNEYKNKERTGDKKTILFISQGTIGRELSLLAVELNRRLDRNKYRILYKLHPGEYEGWKEKYLSLADSGIEVVSNSEYDMYYYFSESDIQIGVYSTAIYEGLGFGLETYIYNIGHANTMKPLVDGNYAKMFDEIEKLIYYLDSAKEQRNSVNFWKENALSNQINEINKYLT